MRPELTDMKNVLTVVYRASSFFQTPSTLLFGPMLVDRRSPKAAAAPKASGPVPRPDDRNGLPTDGSSMRPVRPLTISPRQLPSRPPRAARPRFRPLSAEPSTLSHSRSYLSLGSVNCSLPPLSFSATSCTVSSDSASCNSRSSLSTYHHDCSQRSLASPVRPPPTCPLPPIPPSSQGGLPRSDSHSPDSSSSAAPLSRSELSPSLQPIRRPYCPRLIPRSQSIPYPSTLIDPTLSSLGDITSDDDPFAAEQLVVPPGYRGAGSGWSDDEAVDPIGPAPYVRRRHSSFTESASCYSVNTVIENIALPAERSATVLPVAEHVAAEEPSEEDYVITVRPSEENASTVATRPHRLSASLKRPSMLRGWFPTNHFPATETFSFGPPRRLDGLFFAFQRRPPPKDHTCPAIVLETSPPLSRTAFAPGDPIRARLTLSNVFERIVVGFVGEARLVGQPKMATHVFLEHEIALERPGQWGCWEVARVGDGGDWLVGLKIPKLTTCSCAKRFERTQLEIPSSTVDGQIFMSYHLTVRAIGKHRKAEKSLFGVHKKWKAKGEERLRVSVKVKRKLPEADPRKVVLIGKCGKECVCVG